LIKDSEEGLLLVKKIVEDWKDFSPVREVDWPCADRNAVHALHESKVLGTSTLSTGSTGHLERWTRVEVEDNGRSTSKGLALRAWHANQGLGTHKAAEQRSSPIA
jgi:hypothetical protein